jgi:hypothetical protein
MKIKMTHKNIGYHTRLYSDNTVKVVGGSFLGQLDSETINRLVNSHFDVVVKNSGTCVFVDRNGQEVSLYLTVDPSKTDKGVIAILEWQKEKEKEQAKEDAKQAEIDEIMLRMSNDEILKRLRDCHD